MQMQQQPVLEGEPVLDSKLPRDPNRFYCPYPGCNRSFAELWRLKVHYRAPPDVRGSGKERGHGTELKHCPKCNKELKAGKHHVGCSAGRAGGRTSGKRKAMKQEAENDPTHVDVHIPEMINGAHHFGPPHDPLFAFDHDDVFGNMHHGGVTAHAGQPLTIVVPPQQPHIIHAPPPDADMHPAGGSSYPPGTSPPGAYFTPMPPPNHPHNAFGGGDAMHDPLAEMADALHGPSGEASAPWSGPHSGSGGIPPRHGSGMVTHPGGSVCAPPMMHPTGSMHAPTSLQGTSTGAPAHHANDGHPSWPGFGQPFVVPDVADNDAHGGEDDHTSDLLRGVGLSPSPPPLPPDWDMSVKPSGLLFDFDSFNVSKQQHNTGTRPFVTVTSAMNPTDMVHPSDDYIMQILFGDANEPVPRRMTTHLHQFEMLDDGLPDFDRDLAHEALDDLLSKDHDLDAATPHLTGPSGDMHAGDLAFGHAGGGSLHHHPGGLLPPPNGQIPPAAGHGKGIPPAGCDFPVNDAIKLQPEHATLSIQQ